MSRRLLLFAAVLCLTLPLAAATALPAADAARVDAFVTAALKEKQAPGAVLAIVKDGEVVYRKSYGAVTTGARFEIGSLTKQMAAVAVLRLASEGKLALDGRVGRYIPEYPAAAAVTIRQLLQQTSGLPDFAGTPEFAANGTTRPTDFAGIIASVRDLPPEFAPGQRWKYSNTNYTLIGRIVELASGMAFDDYLATRVLKPAGMTRAGTLGSVADGKAVGYTDHGAGPVPAAVFQNSWIGAAGNLVAGVDDLIAWDGALTTGPWLPMMRQPAALNDGTSAGYGYGLFIDRQAGAARIWHGGGTLGFSSANMLYPEQRLWIIALVNDGDVNASVITAGVYDTLHNIQHLPADGERADITAQVRLWLQRMKRGELPAGEVAPDALPALRAAAPSLQARLDVYGRPEAVLYAGKEGEIYRYRIRYGAQWLQLNISLRADNRLSSLAIAPE